MRKKLLALVIGRIMKHKPIKFIEANVLGQFPHPEPIHQEIPFITKDSPKWLIDTYRQILGDPIKEASFDMADVVQNSSINKYELTTSGGILS